MITKGDESAMNLEAWGVFFSQFLSFSETFVRIGAELRRERGFPVSGAKKAASGRSYGLGL